MNNFDLKFKWWKEFKETNPNSLKEYYNSIPVCFCKECHSLNILIDDILGDYCGDCGCTEIEESSYQDWERTYKYTKIQTKL